MSDNAAAMAEMQRWVAKIRSLPNFARQVAPLVAEKLHENLSANLTAQQAPSGAPWKPAKDGRTMFQSAPGKLQTKASGTVIEAKIKDRVLFRHHAGIARGRIERQMLPSKTVPQPVSDAIKAVLSEKFTELFKGD